MTSLTLPSAFKLVQFVRSDVEYILDEVQIQLLFCNVTCRKLLFDGDEKLKLFKNVSICACVLDPILDKFTWSICELFHFVGWCCIPFQFLII